MIGLLALVQAAGAWVIAPAAPTVGDTVVLERVIAVPSDARLRAQPLGPSLLLEPLAEPATGRGEQGIWVRYQLAFFEPGRHPVAVPTVEVLYRDGRVDVIPMDTAWVSIASVLPAGDSLPPPKPSLGALARYPTRPWPVAVLLLAVAASTAGWAVARRRRPARPGPTDRVRRAPRPPVERWVTAGEGRAVATYAAERLRERAVRLVPQASRSLDTEECIAVLEERRPDWPVRELGEALRALERARFAPAVPNDIVALVERVDDLLDALDGPVHR